MKPFLLLALMGIAMAMPTEKNSEDLEKLKNRGDKRFDFQQYVRQIMHGARRSDSTTIEPNVSVPEVFKFVADGLVQLVESIVNIVNDFTEHMELGYADYEDPKDLYIGYIFEELITVIHFAGIEIKKFEKYLDMDYGDYYDYEYRLMHETRASDSTGNEPNESESDRFVTNGLVQLVQSVGNIVNDFKNHLEPTLAVFPYFGGNGLDELGCGFILGELISVVHFTGIEITKFEKYLGIDSGDDYDYQYRRSTAMHGTRASNSTGNEPNESESVRFIAEGLVQLVQSVGKEVNENKDYFDQALVDYPEYTENEDLYMLLTLERLIFVVYPTATEINNFEKYLA